MRLVFAGTPEVSAPTLRRLAADPRHEIVAVITRQDAPQGRKRVLTASPVADCAGALGLRVIKANRLDDAVTAEVESLGAELGVIVAYGGFVREPLLSLPRLGWINLHFSLLPRWRGAAPVQHAVIAGDAVTGASVFQLVAGMDAGPVFATLRTPIGAHQTSGSLLGALADDGAGLVADVVQGLADGTAVSTPQQGEPTLAPKLALKDARLDFTERSASIYQRLRGVTPEPGAFTSIGGERFKILEAEPAHDAPALAPGQIRLVGGTPVIGTADVPLRLVRVQPSGRKPMAAADWWRGVTGDVVVTDGIADGAAEGLATAATSTTDPAMAGDRTDETREVVAE
ncbi:methionyl-tRNA formyltransferase [Subtercola boreus]|uniref:Methionyl-tRNA formyltransferase n=1 Tax=Subtercola boreus TaxID=120213 RepID=A0A3E0WB79_9MICO|nr:methionyl-tRNA formyltransferase [Subtercola boreus]RFA21295.1 methionyl-tRNA formyltransferase [Subtercola boreus]RFA21678.1 methionyl-tRNA formyltransferase [Subtercola boreus]RFA27647.1 methionyl-tRNA formyltransferase [Subtercola boreus]